MSLARRLIAKAFCPIATRSATVGKTFGLRNQNKGNQNVLTCQINYARSISSVQREFSRYFQALQRKRSNQSNDGPVLTGRKPRVEILSTLSRHFWLGRQKKKKEKKKIPRLILLQNPFSWLMVKLDFKVLKYVWDPSFTEKDFKFGTKQAVSQVTSIIKDGQYNELNGLLTKAARLNLIQELERNWGVKQRSLLLLKCDDIQITSPRRVYFIRIADKKYCDVDMAFLALKWVPINSVQALVFTEIFARFHREYTPHSIPEWTIAFFKVTRFEVLRIEQ